MKKGKPLPLLHSTLLVILVVVLLVNLYISSSMNLDIHLVKKEAEEAARPAELSLTVITADCENCESMDAVVSALKQNNVEFIEENTLSLSEADGLIEKYQIEKFPTVIITGEVDKSGNMGLERIDNALVKTDILPPFVDAEGKTRGDITLTIITDSSCAQCADLTSIANTLVQAGMSIEENSVDYGTPEGKLFAEQFKVEKLPTLVLEGDISIYEELSEALREVGTLTENSFVLDTATPPYRDLETGNIRGIVDLIFIADESCEECYEPTLHKQILSRLGMTFGSERVVDVSSSEGQSLVTKYNIESVPTVVIDREASTYTLFERVWTQVGSKEEDGNFLFRRNDALGANSYKVLATGEVRSGQAQTQ